MRTMRDVCALLQVCRSNPAEKGRYIKFILALLQSTSTAVVYECAVTLVSLSQACSLLELLKASELHCQATCRLPFCSARLPRAWLSHDPSLLCSSAQGTASCLLLTSARLH